MRSLPLASLALRAGFFAGVAATLGLSLAACAGPEPETLAAAPRIGATTQIAPGPGLPLEYQELRAQLGARSNNNLDVVRHGGRVYLATRLSRDHFASADSTLFIFSSRDEKSWSFETRIWLGTDVREPRFLSYRGRLFLYFAKLGTSALGFEPQGMLVTERQPDGRWSAPTGFYQPGAPYIPWRAKERGGVAYLVTYRDGQNIYNFSGAPMDVELLRSDEGLSWSGLRPGSPRVERGGGSETDFDLDERGDLYAVIRNEAGDETGWGSKICRAEADELTRWSCRHDPRKYDSPLVFAHGGQIFLVGRRTLSGPGSGSADDPGGDAGRYELRPLAPGEAWSAQETVKNQVEYSATPKRCSLWQVMRDSLTVRWLVDVPGWGDTCFPALLPDESDPHKFALYNYSSPLDMAENGELAWSQAQKGETRIYRTEITMP